MGLENTYSAPFCPCSLMVCSMCRQGLLGLVSLGKPLVREENPSWRVIRASITCCCCLGFGWYLSAVLEVMQSSFFWSGGLHWAVTNHFSVLGRALGWSNGAELQGWLLFLPGESSRYLPFTLMLGCSYSKALPLKSSKTLSPCLSSASIHFLRLVARAVLETGLVTVKI